MSRPWEDMTGEEFFNAYRGRRVRCEGGRYEGEVMGWAENRVLVSKDDGYEMNDGDRARYHGVPGARHGELPSPRNIVEVLPPLVDLSRYPHKCPGCGGAAYVGLVLIECAAGCGGRRT